MCITCSGAGEFLFALKELYPSVNVAGIDYAAGQIEVATVVLPDGKFAVQNAVQIDTDTTFDFVLANGVFHYFSPQDSEIVLKRMIKKARHAVAVTEIPDSALQDELELIRRGALNTEEYDKKYAGLKHTYYEKSWFTETVPQWNLGILEVTVTQGMIPNYAQNRYRYNCFISRVK